MRKLFVVLFILSMPLGLYSCVYRKAEMDKALEAELKVRDSGKIPTAAFFQDPEFRDLKISPDGRFLASIFTNNNGKIMLGVTSNDLKTIHNIVSFDGDMNVMDFH